MAPVDHVEMTHVADWAERLTWLDGDDLCGRWRQEFAAVSDDRFAIAVEKESEMSDLDEPAGEHVQEEPAYEVDRVE